MKICVCVKEVEQVYARTGMDPERHFLNREDRIYRINPYDEAAMALALKAKVRLGDAQIVVLTLGPWQAENELWRIMAMGADQLYRIELTESENTDHPPCDRMDSWSKAQVLSHAVHTVGSDLVLCGKESLDGQNGLVGAIMARLLGRSFVSGILDLNMESGAEGVRVIKNAGKGRREAIDCRLPAVLSVDLGPGLSAMPAYAEIRRVRSLEATRMIYDSRLLTPKTLCASTFAPRPRTRPIAAPDSSLTGFERVQLLLAGSRIQKKGKMVHGSAKSQAQEIIEFLEEHGIILSSPQKGSR